MTSLDCTYRSIESCSEHGCWSLGLVVLCVVIGLCDGLILPRARSYVRARSRDLISRRFVTN
jgi:hypothetical protein